MFGNVVNNKQLLKLKEASLIRISPFYEKRLQTIHYPLNIKLVSKFGDDGEMTEYLLRMNKPYILEPNEYVVVEIDEHIELASGIIGEFIPSSNLIEKGLFLTCGKLDSIYGKNGETIRFGMKNLLNREVAIEFDLKIAYVRFFDLRALDNFPYLLSDEEKILWARRARKAIDDGVFYDE